MRARCQGRDRGASGLAADQRHRCAEGDAVDGELDLAFFVGLATPAVAATVARNVIEAPGSAGLLLDVTLVTVPAITRVVAWAWSGVAWVLPARSVATL